MKIVRIVMLCNLFIISSAVIAQAEVTAVEVNKRKQNKIDKGDHNNFTNNRCNPGDPSSCGHPVLHHNNSNF